MPLCVVQSTEEGERQNKKGSSWLKRCKKQLWLWKYTDPWSSCGKRHKLFAVFTLRWPQSARTGLTLGALGARELYSKLSLLIYLLNINWCIIIFIFIFYFIFQNIINKFLGVCNFTVGLLTLHLIWTMYVLVMTEWMWHACLHIFWCFKMHRMICLPRIFRSLM